MHAYYFKQIFGKKYYYSMLMNKNDGENRKREETA